MFLKTSVGIQRKIYENIPGGVSEWIPRRVNVKIKKKCNAKKSIVSFVMESQKELMMELKKKYQKSPWKLF